MKRNSGLWRKNRKWPKVGSISQTSGMTCSNKCVACLPLVLGPFTRFHVYYKVYHEVYKVCLMQCVDTEITKRKLRIPLQSTSFSV